MRGTIVLGLLSLMGQTLAQSGGDLVEFPSTGEIDIVFPRNETYAVEAPFPVIFGFQNAPALLSFPTIMYWELKCEKGSLFGIGRHEGERATPPPSDPYFFINSSDVLRKPEEGDQYKYFRGETDTCVLSFEFTFYTTCERQANGDLRIMGGNFGRRKGNVTFTLQPGKTTARDAIANYKGCPVGGTAVRIQSNETGCAQIADDSAPETQPCELDVESAASSLAAVVVSPTTSLTAAPATSTSGGEVTSTGSSSSSAATGGSSGGGDGGSSNGGDGGSWASPQLTVSGGVIAVVVTVVTGGLIPFLL